VALLRDFVCDRGQITNGVADVVEALGGGDFAKLGAGHEVPSKAKLLTAKDAKTAAKFAKEFPD
jgi:hypothetical protein